MTSKIHDLKFICIVGKKNTGKTTLAQMLVRSAPSYCRDIALADELKRMAAAAFDVDIKVFNDQELKECAMYELFGQTPRKCMQMFGTDFMQKFVNKYIWCDVAVSKLMHEGRTGDVVISDIRFPHEVDYFNKLGATFIVIETPGDNMWTTLKNIFKGTHISERGAGSYTKATVSMDRVHVLQNDLTTDSILPTFADQFWADQQS